MSIDKIPFPKDANPPYLQGQPYDSPQQPQSIEEILGTLRTKLYYKCLKAGVGYIFDEGELFQEALKQLEIYYGAEMLKLVELHDPQKGKQVSKVYWGNQLRQAIKERFNQ